ncbi:MAG: energy transducer TonB [Pseudomonadota bacterium]
METQTATPLPVAPQTTVSSPAARPSGALLALTAPSAPTALAIDTAPAPIPLLDQSGKVQRSLRPSPRPQTAEAQAAAEAAEAKSQAAQAASAARRQQRAAGSGGGARAGSGSSSVQAQRSSASRASLQARWGAQIQSSIARFHGCGGLRGASGRAVVNVRVSRGGGLVSVRVVRSSGSGAIDRAAVASVRRTGGFPSAPAGLSGSRFDFQLPLSFRC